MHWVCSSVTVGAVVGLIADRFPVHVVALETGAGILLIGGFALTSSPLPVNTRVSAAARENAVNGWLGYAIGRGHARDGKLRWEDAHHHGLCVAPLVRSSIWASGCCTAASVGQGSTWFR